MNLILNCSSLALLLASVAASAAAPKFAVPDIKPGLWETTTTF